MATTTQLSKKIPVLIGFCIVALVIGTILTRGAFTRASDDRPTDVTINPDPENPTTGVIVSWTTGNATQGQILYSADIDGPDNNPDVAPEESQTTNHTLKLRDLEEGKTYYFKIQIGENVFDNGGVPWSFIAASTDNLLPGESIPDSGTAGNRSVTPIQHLVIPPKTAVTSAPTAEAQSCNYTDCETIQLNFGKGCSTQDYIKCLKQTPAP